jgi:hypothetical protein
MSMIFITVGNTMLMKLRLLTTQHRRGDEWRLSERDQ